jgi:hypothetical protein
MTTDKPAVTPGYKGRVVAARITPWELPGQFGVMIDYSDGHYIEYCVGTLEEATAEAARRLGLNSKSVRS